MCLLLINRTAIKIQSLSLGWYMMENLTHPGLKIKIMNGCLYLTSEKLRMISHKLCVGSSSAVSWDLAFRWSDHTGVDFSTTLHIVYQQCSYVGFPSHGRVRVSHSHLISCLRKEDFFFLMIESYKRKSEKVFLIGSLNRYIVMSHCISLFAMFAYTWTSYCKDNRICRLAWPGAEGSLNSI